jgi:hypothetical protein
MKKLFWTRKKMIKEFAKEIATLQMKADKWFYVLNDKEQSSWILDQAWEIKKWCERLGFSEEVYKEAYKLYDFRDSGKETFVPNIELLTQTDVGID